MSQVARRVIGVQGNHDTFSSTFRQLGTCHLLDGTSTGSIAGVSLIAGNVDKPGRRSEAEQARRIREVTRHAPEVLLLHEGPPGTGAGERGSRFIIDALHEAFDGLIICGHCHWPTPLSTCAEHQVLNVDARAILVTT
jgi:calcineurin-like phosphoesterase family protein